MHCTHYALLYEMARVEQRIADTITIQISICMRAYFQITPGHDVRANFAASIAFLASRTIREPRSLWSSCRVDVFWSLHQARRVSFCTRTCGVDRFLTASRAWASLDRLFRRLASSALRSLSDRQIYFNVIIYINVCCYIKLHAWTHMFIVCWLSYPNHRSCRTPEAGANVVDVQRHLSVFTSYGGFGK